MEESGPAPEERLELYMRLPREAAAALLGPELARFYLPAAPAGNAAGGCGGASAAPALAGAEGAEGRPRAFWARGGSHQLERRGPRRAAMAAAEAAELARLVRGGGQEAPPDAGALAIHDIRVLSGAVGVRVSHEGLLDPSGRILLRLWRGIACVQAAERGEPYEDASDDLRAAAGAEEAAPRDRATALVYMARALLARRAPGAAEAHQGRPKAAARGCCSSDYQAQACAVRAGLGFAAARRLPPGSPEAGRALDRAAEHLCGYLRQRAAQGHAGADSRCFGRQLAAWLRRAAGIGAVSANRWAELAAARVAAKREWGSAVEHAAGYYHFGRQLAAWLRPERGHGTNADDAKRAESAQP